MDQFPSPGSQPGEGNWSICPGESLVRARWLEKGAQIAQPRAQTAVNPQIPASLEPLEPAASVRAPACPLTPLYAKVGIGPYPQLGFPHWAQPAGDRDVPQAGPACVQPAGDRHSQQAGEFIGDEVSKDLQKKTPAHEENQISRSLAPGNWRRRRRIVE